MSGQGIGEWHRVGLPRVCLEVIMCELHCWGDEVEREREPWTDSVQVAVVSQLECPVGAL